MGQANFTSSIASVDFSKLFLRYMSSAVFARWSHLNGAHFQSVRRVLFILLLLIGSPALWSQTEGPDVNYNKLSPLAAKLINEIQGKEVFKKELIIKRLSGQSYVNVLFKPVHGSHCSSFEDYDLKPGSATGGFCTALVPLERLEELVLDPRLEYLELGDMAHPHMDSARVATNTDLVHNGFQLPNSYLGDSVVVGVIDFGLDYTHPNFYDTTITDYRVKRVWDQRATSGTPPMGFAYGNELTTRSTILAAQRDVVNATHGTHVAGIAAGSGAGSGGAHRGIAPSSDIVLVGTTYLATDIVDAITYIFNYADAVQKPCVINMSFGGHTGPHDGQSSFDQFCDGVTGEGRLLVGSAGNDGGLDLHLAKSYSATDTLVETFVEYSGGQPSQGYSAVDIWGDPGQDFEVSIAIYNTNTNTIEDQTPFYRANISATYNDTLIDADASAPDPCYIFAFTQINPLNNKPRVYLELDHTAQDDGFRWVMLKIKADTGQTKMWAVNNQTEFSDNGYSLPVEGGVNHSTVSEYGGTGKRVLSIGAFTAKNSYIDWTGTQRNIGFFTPNGAVAPFSSKGPTADGRTKPDITAPGKVVVSSFSRFHTVLDSTSSAVVSGVTDGVDQWYYGRLQGTSMSAPVVTGILALWLQVYPDLTPEQARLMIQQSAITDGFTGVIPQSGDTTWGWGKIDAHGGMLDLLSQIPVRPGIQPADTVSFCDGDSVVLNAMSGLSSFEWTSSDTVQSLTIDTSGTYAVRVSDSLGFKSPWSDTTRVIVFALPPQPTISVNGKQLTSSATAGNQWYRNNSVIPGADQQLYTAVQSGVYHVRVTNADSCFSESDTVHIAFVGLVEVFGEGYSHIFPNPAGNEVSVLFQHGSENVQVELWSAKGELLLREDWDAMAPGTVRKLELSGWDAGLYKVVFKTPTRYSCSSLILR